MKDNFLRDLELNLSTKFNPETRERVMQCVIASLKDYEVEKKSTDIVVYYTDANERILKRYIACLRIDGKSENTIKQYLNTLLKLSEAVSKPLTDVTTFEIRYFLGTIKERGCKNQYIENQRANISAFYGWLFSEDMISKNPCEKINPIKVEDVIRLPFSAVEIDRMRASCKSIKNRAMVEMLLSTGLRCEELINLKVSDVDLQHKTVMVRSGKGGKDRVTFMSDIAVEYLRKYLNSRKHDSEYVINNRRSDAPISTDAVRRALKKIGNASNIDDVHPHRFRRTFATELYRRGMDIYSIGKLMGHSNIATTKRYIYTANEQLQADYTKYSA